MPLDSAKLAKLMRDNVTATKNFDLSHGYASDFINAIASAIVTHIKADAKVTGNVASHSTIEKGRVS